MPICIYYRQCPYFDKYCIDGNDDTTEIEFVCKLENENEKGTNNGKTDI